MFMSVVAKLLNVPVVPAQTSEFSISVPSQTRSFDIIKFVSFVPEF